MNKRNDTTIKRVGHNDPINMLKVTLETSLFQSITCFGIDNLTSTIKSQNVQETQKYPNTNCPNCR